MNLSGASLLALSATALTSTQAWIQPVGSRSRAQFGAGVVPVARQLDSGTNRAMQQAFSGASSMRGATVNHLPGKTTALTAVNDADNGAELGAETGPSEGLPTDKIARESRELIRDSKTLSFGLPSVMGDHTELSYAPFVFEDKPLQFFVLGSPIAGASRALLAAAQTGKPAAVMFLAPEGDTKQMFARKRVILQVQAKIVPRNSEQWHRQVDQMREKFGNVVNMISAMPDFNMVALSPTSGRLIKGFGQAHDLVGDNLESSRPAIGDHKAEGGQHRGNAD